MTHRIALAGLLSSLLLLACAAELQPAPTVAPAAGEGMQAAAASRPLLIVHKTPWCGCCEIWAEQAERAGFAVELRDSESLDPIKRALGVPERMASCHTAEVDGYFVEGHVPFADIHRLLAERPEARGIAVPGMPMGSPGMEGPRRQSFSTHLVGRDGSLSEYAHHPGDEHQH